MTKQKLHALIDKFLKERKKSTGGYAPVSQEEIDTLCNIVQSLIELKYQPDPDGDVPVEFTIVDRTQYERLGYGPIPYIDKANTEKEQLLAVELAHMNMDIANEAFRRTMQHYLWRRKGLFPIVENITQNKTTKKGRSK